MKIHIDTYIRTYVHTYTHGTTAVTLTATHTHQGLIKRVLISAIISMKRVYSLLCRFHASVTASSTV